MQLLRGSSGKVGVHFSFAHFGDAGSRANATICCDGNLLQWFDEQCNFICEVELEQRGSCHGERFRIGDSGWRGQHCDQGCIRQDNRQRNGDCDGSDAAVDFSFSEHGVNCCWRYAAI